MSYNFLDKTGLAYFWNKIKAKLDLKTNTSVIPNDNGEIKTKYRIANKAYTGTNNAIWYYPLCKFPVDNGGNYASAIISGRIGGWVNSNMSYINALAWNRSGTGISVLDIAGGATSMGNIWGICDIVIYTDAETVSETANDNGVDTVYLKCKSYFTFDLDIEMFQSSASIIYDGTYITTEPTGTLVAQASTSTKRAELINGKLYVAGSELAKVSSIPTKTSQLTNDSGYTSNTGTVTSVAVKMNNTTKGTVTTSGTIDLGTVITAHQDISGKQDKLTAGSNIQITNNTISATDTKYSSKAAASGGTDVSLVTTGEKYTWNNKTSNTGTVTSVAVKMNGATKGTVTTSGTIDLGTVITAHQDISGKQDKLATQTAYTAKGSATKVPQITTNTLGQVTRIAEVTITQPTVNNGTLTIQKNGTSVGTFTANQSGNSTANITVPTKTSDLANDNDFITSDDGTIINIVSLTKAGYEDLVTKTPNTLYNITNDYTASTIRSGTGTLSTTYISNAEFNHWERVGNVVSYAFTITAKGTWTTNNGFVSGLPKPVATIRFTGINHSRNIPMRFEILNDGQIRNAYSTTTPSAGNTLEGQITYITSDI